ncbi:hypothetical protein HD806DRAFT_534112 [Xylariaceae sp. AK1471]|nr:hypothetical protein HD806DRAFT_534112 [Xylariaceae sp. AK1471]
MQFTTFALAALSIGSAFAAPTAVVRSDPKILTSAISAVSDAKSAVDSQVAIIDNLVQTTVNDATVPALKASLKNIAAEISSVTKLVVPLVTGVVLPLAEEELANLPGFVGNVRDIELEIQVTVNLILARLPSATLSLVKTELVLVVATVNPFVTPVTTFANAAIAGTSGPSTDSVRTAIAAIQSILAQILGPITVALQKIL